MASKQPGCFGFASTYNVGSKVCQSCDFATECGVKAKETVEILRDKVNVDALIRLMQQEKTKKTQEKRVEAAKSVNPMIEKITANLPKHVARAATQLLSSGVNHRKSLIKGKNTLRGKSPKSMEVLFDLVIETQHATQKQLLKRLEDAGYQTATASSLASICLSAASSVGILKQTEGVYKLRGI